MTAAPAPALRTRKPTGAVPWPLILVEGGEKSGKSWACAELSASKRVGQTYWLDLGEGAADEYAAIPGARYEVIDHNGTWHDILGQVYAVRQEAQRAAAAGEPPVVLVIDSMSNEWDELKDWATSRARKTESNRKKLAADPDAEIKVAMNFWNDANTRHKRLMKLVMKFPGIVIVTARGKDVAAMDGSGRPVENTKEYKVEGQKAMAFDASAWVRMSRDAAPEIVGARSVHAGVWFGKKDSKTAKNFSLEWLIFEVLKCDPQTAHVRNMPEPDPKNDQLARDFRDKAVDPHTTYLDLRRMHGEAKEAGLLDAEVIDDKGDDTTLGDLIVRFGNEAKEREKNPAPRVDEPTTDPTQAAADVAALEAEFGGEAG